MPAQNLYKPKEKEKSIYSSPGTANSSRAAAAGMQNAPQSSTLQNPKREKSSSERGEEVVCTMLKDEGLPEPEGNETPAARTFTAGVGRSDITGPAVNAARNAAPGDGLSVGTGNAGEDAGPTQAIPDLLPPLPMPDQYNPELVSAELKAGLWFGQGLKQLCDDTHIAEGMSVPLYWIDRGVNAGERFFEGIWNYGVDSVEAGADFALEQQKQQAQQWAPLGGLYQNHADFVSDNVQIAQEKLPELAEYFRRHEAAKHLQEIEDMYDAGGLIKIGGDTASGLVQIGAAGTIGALTGGGGGLIALGASAAGNAADEARAGGADDKTAYMYGNLVGLVEVGTELLSGGIPGLPKGLLDNALANVAETNMGRLATKAVQDALGEGAEEFIGTMAEAYLAKLWNGDERGAWQTFEETFPDALYAAFQGAATSMIMNAPGNISNIQYARALDAAIDVLNNGGTVTEAESAAANAALQYLTGSWGEDSAWSRAATQTWESARNRNFENFFPPNFISLPMFKNLDTAQENPSNSSDTNFPPITDSALDMADAQGQEIEIQDVEGNERNDPIELEKDVEPKSEALPSEEKGDMLSKEEREALGRAWVSIPRIPSSLLNSDQQTHLREACRRILKFAADIPRDAEVTMLYRMDMTQIPIEEGGIIVGEPGAGRVDYIAPNEPFISLHNHSDGRTFSEGDIKSFLESDNYKIMVAVGHNGKVYVLEKYEGFNSVAALDFFENAKTQYPNRTESAEIYVPWMEEYVIKGVEQYGASYYSG